MSARKVVALGVAAVLALGVVVFGLRWVNRGAEIVGPDNVAAQYRAVIEGWETLQTSAANACAAQSAAPGEDSPTLVESPELAYAATYRRIAAEYNRRQANIFEAGLVGPEGYPDRAPATSAATDWCALAEELAVTP